MWMVVVDAYRMALKLRRRLEPDVKASATVLTLHGIGEAPPTSLGFLIYPMGAKESYLLLTSL